MNNHRWHVHFVWDWKVWGLGVHFDRFGYATVPSWIFEVEFGPAAVFVTYRP